MQEYIEKQELINYCRFDENIELARKENWGEIITMEDIDRMKKVTQEEIIERALKADDKGGWIPCSERMPEENVDVLVWFEYNRYGDYNRLFKTIGISYVFNGRWSGFVNGSSGWTQLRIIAWQPLPEPYREE